jgi:hypothetical protein
MRAAVTALGLGFALTMALALSACGDKPQELHTAKTDSKAWDAAQNAYVAPGWKPGDQTSWEEQIHQRAQSQNEYVRTGTGAN